MAIKGMAEVRRNLKRTLEQVIPERAAAAMHVAGSIIANHATLLTPIDSGNLARSQYQTVVESDGVVAAKIGYTAKYAKSVHNASGKLKGQPRAHFGKTREGVEFGGGTLTGEYWDPDAEPKFLQKAGDDHLDEIDAAIKKVMKL